MSCEILTGTLLLLFNMNLLHNHTHTYHGHVKITIDCVYYATRNELQRFALPILGQCTISIPPENVRKPLVWYKNGTLA